MARTPRKKKEAAPKPVVEGIQISEASAFTEVPKNRNLGEVALALDNLQAGTFVVIKGVDYKKLSAAATQAKKRAKENGETRSFSVRVVDSKDASQGVGVYRTE